MNKKCSWCCDPVKVHQNFPKDKIPKNNDKETIWTKREEILVPESHPETIKIETYDCKNLDKKTGFCKDYENRPEICKNSGCVNETSKETIDEQHRKTVEEKFYRIIKK